MCCPKVNNTYFPYIIYDANNTIIEKRISTDILSPDIIEKLRNKLKNFWNTCSLEIKNRKILAVSLTFKDKKAHILIPYWEKLDKILEKEYADEGNNFLVLTDRRGNILYSDASFQKLCKTFNRRSKNFLKILNINKNKLKITTFKEIIKKKPHKHVLKLKIDNKFLYLEIHVLPLSIYKKIWGFLIRGKDITLYQHEKEKLRNRLLSLMEISEKIISYSQIKPINSFFKEVIRKACILTNAKYGILRILKNKEEFLVSASYNLSDKYLDKLKVIKEDESIWGQAISKRKPVFIRDIRNKNFEFKDIFLQEGIISFLCVPIIFNNQILGTIGIGDNKRRLFEKEEIYLLKSFASHIGVVVNSIRQEIIINENYFNSLNSLILTMEARDPYTKGHSERVTRIALDIAGKMNLGREQLMYLRFCTLVHDIGKIAIPDGILLKPDKLTFRERAEIQLHPLKGVQIVKPLKFLEPGINIIKYHHERYDGKGYPEGLKKDKIPLLARIVSVADAYDAMVSNRPYRKKFPPQQALEEIKRNRGSQFDPEIVDIFLRLVG